MNFSKLSPKQSEVVNFSEGALLVKASAGSGKTRVLTERIKRLLGLTKRKILAITFTNKAGEEMKERLKDIEDLKSRLFIGTFHSFCQHVLESHGKLIGLSQMPHILEEEADRLKLIEEALNESPYYLSIYKAKSKRDQHAFLYNLHNLISDVKRNLYSEEQILNETQDQSLISLYREYQDILNSQGVIDFDDLIMLTYNLFASQQSVASLYRRTYEFICIDEAQDLNYAQYQLLRILTGNEHKNIMMVGDPNQSIFAFNGSSSDYMNIEFVKDFNPFVVLMTENYRSSKSILNAASKIISIPADIENVMLDGKFEIHEMANETEEAHYVYNKIMELLNKRKDDEIEGDIDFEKITILARNKYLFNPLAQYFSEMNLPYSYKVAAGSLKYETKFMQIFDLAFKVKINPQDSLHFERLKSLLNITSKNDLGALLEKSHSGVYKEVIKAIIDLKEDGSDLKRSVNGIRGLLKDSAEFYDDNEKNMIFKELGELESHWFNYASKIDKKSLTNFKNSMALGQTDPVSQNLGITFSTIHSMKGLENDIIFLIGMDDETFPDYRSIKAGSQALVQERNNLYVAFTRAKRFLFITWPRERLMPWGDRRKRNVSRLLAPLFSNQ